MNKTGKYNVSNLRRSKYHLGWEYEISSEFLLLVPTILFIRVKVSRFFVVLS